MLTRRAFLAAAVAGTSAAFWTKGAIASAADAPAAANGPTGFALSVQPTRVFKRSSDQNRLRMEYWLFNLLLRAPTQEQAALESLVVECLSRGQVVRSTA